MTVDLERIRSEEQYDSVTGCVAAVCEPDDTLEIRILPSKASLIVKASELHKKIPWLNEQNLAGENIYVGPNPRKPGTRGTDDEHTLLARCVWVDIDGITPDEALRRLSDSGLPAPILAVDSGHGVHFYWRLTEPLTDFTKWTEIQKRLSQHLDSDRKVCNPSRIMRLPGFVNHKPPLANARVLSIDLSKTCTLAELEAILPQLQAIAPPPAQAAPRSNFPRNDNVLERAAAYVSRCEPSISGQRGHDKAMRAARVVAWGFDLGADQAYAILCAHFNPRCEPPWSEAELRHKCHDADTKSCDKPRGWLLTESNQYDASSPLHSNETASSSGRDAVQYEEDGEIASVPTGVISVPLPLEVFAAQHQRLITEVARTASAAPEIAAACLLGVASVGIGNSRHAGVWQVGAEPPILYIAVVANPGEGKSPVMRILAAPVYKRQAELAQQYTRQKLEYDEDKEKHELAKKNGEVSVAPVPPQFMHIIVNDATQEKTAEMLRDNRGALSHQDEVSALTAGENAYRGGLGRDRQFILSTWSGEKLKIDRKSHPLPLMVERPFMSIIGGIQPGMVGKLRAEHGREDGFVHRWLFTYPPPHPLLPWDAPSIDHRVVPEWQECFIKLLTLEQVVEPSGELRPWVCRLTTAASKQWNQWHEKKRVIFNAETGQTRGHVRKVIAYAARLSLVMQMLYWSVGETDENRWIEDRAITAGCKLADYFLGQYQLVALRLHDDPEDQKVHELAEWIKSQGGATSVRLAVREGPRWLKKSSEAIKLFRSIEDRGIGQYYETTKKNGKIEKGVTLVV